MKSPIFTRLAVVLAASSLFACAKGRLEVDVNKSIETNSTAMDHLAWESSENHPTQVFGRWQMERAQSEDVCAVLRDQTDAKLTIFEEEIKKKSNENLLSGCRAELLDRLAKYWKVAEAAAEDVNLSFKFKPSVQSRDFTAGYVCFTCDVGRREIVLTIDDGPHGEYTPLILKTLEKVGGKAMFFAQGVNVRAHPEVLKKVAEGGHVIGSHTMGHYCLPNTQRCDDNNKKRETGMRRKLTFSEAAAEIMGGHQAVYDVLGWVDPVFRFPYGESSDELKKFLRSREVGEFAWNMDSNDWKERPIDEMIDDAMGQVRKQTRGVILFHDVWHRTALALPRFLNLLYFEGYNLVVVNSETAKQDRLASKMVKLKQPAANATKP